MQSLYRDIISRRHLSYVVFPVAEADLPFALAVALLRAALLYFQRRSITTPPCGTVTV